MNEKLSQSLETYLSSIDFLLKHNKTVIVKDIANYLQVGGASASDAVKKLKDKGYINYEPYSNITLTDKGEKTIIIKQYRHDTIKKFLNKVLDIDLKNADKNATAIEYSMTENVLERFVNFMDFMEQCICSEQKWIKSCRASLKSGELNQNCKNCSGHCSCKK